MTVEEIFRDVSAHMIKGLMLHSQLADYYLFLGLPRYAKCHEKHYEKESCLWRKLSRYYEMHFNKLIEEKAIENPNIIPKDWYRYTRQQVDANTVRKSVATGMNTWVEWESLTKKTLTKMVTELESLGEVSASMELKKILRKVDEELADAQKYSLLKKSIDYNINALAEENM